MKRDIVLALLVVVLSGLGGSGAQAASVMVPISAESPVATSTTNLEIGQIGSSESSTVAVEMSGKSIAMPAQPTPPAVSSGPSLSVQAESCYWAQPTGTINGGENTGWYYIEYCASGGVITKVLTLYCDGRASSGWQYTGCSVNHGSTGFTTLKVTGSWDYRYGCCGVYLYRYLSVDATHYPDGRIVGTWYASQ